MNIAERNKSGKISEKSERKNEREKKIRMRQMRSARNDKNKKNRLNRKTEKTILRSSYALWLLTAGMLLASGGCTPTAKPDPQTEPASSVVTDPGTGSSSEENTDPSEEKKDPLAKMGQATHKTIAEGVESLVFDLSRENEDTRIMPYKEGFVLLEAASTDMMEEEGGSVIRFLDREGGEILGREFPDLNLSVDRTILYADGTIGVSLREACSYVWFDSELNRIGSFDLEEWKAKDPSRTDLDMYMLFPCSNRRSGYFFSNGILHYLDMETGVLSDLELNLTNPEETYLTALLFDDTVLELLSYENSQPFYYLYDITTPDKPVFLSKNGIYLEYATSGRDYMGLYENLRAGEKRLIAGTLSDPETIWCGESKDLPFGSARLGKRGMISLPTQESNSVGYILPWEERVCRIDLSPYMEENATFVGGGEMFDEASKGDDGTEEPDLYMNYCSYENGTMQILLIDADRFAVPCESEFNHVSLEERSDREMIEKLQIEDPNLYQVNVLQSKYASLDDYVKAISEESGVKILYDSSVESYYEAASDFQITPLIPDETTWEILATLDRTLDSYPDDFFRQLHSDAYPGGAVICLVAGISGAGNPDTVDSADGIAATDEDEHVVFLTAFSMNMEQNIYHEFSHVIDHHIEPLLWNGVSDEYYDVPLTWTEFNPEGFEYEQSYANYDSSAPSDGSQYTVYGYEDGSIGLEDIYFIDYYSTLYATEDRARIMEFSCIHYPDGYMSAPHIQNKIRYMSEYIRYYFDDSAWPQVLPWEKGLSAIPVPMDD